MADQHFSAEDKVWVCTEPPCAFDVHSRDDIGDEPEPHAPNTYLAECEDGDKGKYTKSPSIERIFFDGSDIKVEVYCKGHHKGKGCTSNKLKFYFYDFNNWVYFGEHQCPDCGLYNFTMQLPSFLRYPGRYLVRTQLTHKNNIDECIDDKYVDHDDFIFYYANDPPLITSEQPQPCSSLISFNVSDDHSKAFAVVNLSSYLFNFQSDLCDFFQGKCFSGSASYTEGIYGKCVVPTSDLTLDLSLSNFSIMFFVSPKNQEIFNYGFTFGYSSGSFYVYSDGAWCNVSADNDWHQIALVYDGSKIQFYLDAELENTCFMPVELSDTLRFYQGNYFLDSLYIASYPAHPYQVRAHYHATNEFSFNLLLPDGDYSYTICAFDDASQHSCTPVYSLHIDTTPPSITKLSPPSSTYSPVLFNASCEDNFDCNVWLIFGGYHELPYTKSMSPGTYSAKYYANDSCGNSAELGFSFTVKQKQPSGGQPSGGGGGYGGGSGVVVGLKKKAYAEYKPTDIQQPTQVYVSKKSMKLYLLVPLLLIIPASFLLIRKRRMV